MSLLLKLLWLGGARGVCVIRTGVNMSVGGWGRGGGGCIHTHTHIYIYRERERGSLVYVYSKF